MARHIYVRRCSPTGIRRVTVCAMSLPDADTAVSLVLQAQEALGMSLSSVGKVMGLSRRTMSRWMRDRGTSMYPSRAEALARAVHPRDADLAARIAAAGGLTLAHLGLKTTAETTLEQTASMRVDAVVCAAAETLDASPRAVRPALLAALRRAREVGLSLDQLEAWLAASLEAAAATRPSAPSKGVTPRGKGRGKMGNVVDG